MRIASVMLTMAALVGTPSIASAQRDGDERKGDEPVQKDRPSDPRAPERRPSDPRAPERRDAERRRMRSRFRWEFELRSPRRNRREDNCLWSEFVMYQHGRYVIVHACVDVYGQY